MSQTHLCCLSVQREIRCILKSVHFPEGSEFTIHYSLFLFLTESMSHTDFGDFKRIRSNKLNLWYISNTRLRKSVSKDLGGFQQNIVNILSCSHPWLSAVSYGASKSKSTVITARAQFPILAQRTLQALMARSHVNTSRAENSEER